MKRLLNAAIAVLALATGGGAQAGAFADTITDNYWGADGHGYGDVIGGSTYNINDAKITRVNDVLTITIGTNFAGHAGADSFAGPGGIGYGDVFLADTWNPVGTATDHYTADNAANSTIWDYGFNLANRWSNTGGTFTLYKLNGATNAQNISNSESFITCTSCTYRNGQEVAVKTNSSTVSTTVKGLNSGTWTVLADKSLQFTINVAGTDLAKFSTIAMHWGETCQNDVIEGVVRLTPIPGTLPLLAAGLAGLYWMRRRRRA
ncbi:hypothetical protein GCM10027277_56900 [Pseudoduganella ginsengisoli]|uniref:PEP-CTERM sorting domain-containing protein n=1 Tax=Pseudoduganella ginsengisoli TaxID=1462440 RepID=A0A6L6Q278_9BURK|nr:VPLPA-CTERM sorting domain-containing protein [Pseudoduganella ginsengisoli]MTW03937.1 PEP-CTERM sorting domain-containing protein [Pseudoduganella ginsengisoli]